MPCSAVTAGYIADSVIEHNQIAHLSYSGVSLGWGWGREDSYAHNNTVRFNHIHHHSECCSRHRRCMHGLLLLLILQFRLRLKCPLLPQCVGRYTMAAGCTPSVRRARPNTRAPSITTTSTTSATFSAAFITTGEVASSIHLTISSQSVRIWSGQQFAVHAFCCQFTVDVPVPFCVLCNFLPRSQASRRCGCWSTGTTVRHRPGPIYPHTSRTKGISTSPGVPSTPCTSHSFAAC